MEINCIVIEDEPPAREKLANYIAKISELNLLGIYENPIEAAEIVKSKNLDLIFSDIQMPEMDGIAFLRSLKDPPFVIFITAHPNFAIEGFELEVLDYILKPLTLERLKKAAERAKSAVEYRRSKTGVNLIKIKDRNKILFMKPSDIYYVQGWGDYVRIINNESVIIGSYSMKEMEKILPGEYFVRIQRSYIVNLDYIASADATKVILKNKKGELPLGLQYRNTFYKRMGIKQ